VDTDPDDPLELLDDELLDELFDEELLDEELLDEEDELLDEDDGIRPPGEDDAELLDDPLPIAVGAVTGSHPASSRLLAATAPPESRIKKSRRFESRVSSFTIALHLRDHQPSIGRFDPATQEI
jgi:hypothetical protein